MLIASDFNSEYFPEFFATFPMLINTYQVITSHYYRWALSNAREIDEVSSAGIYFNKIAPKTYFLT